VSDLAGEASVPAPDPAVADDGTAQSLTEEQIREVVQGRGAGVVAFGLRRPVHVVVDGDRPVDVWRQDAGRRNGCAGAAAWSCGGTSNANRL
jgi:hypothetical protein